MRRTCFFFASDRDPLRWNRHRAHSALCLDNSGSGEVLVFMQYDFF